MNSRATGKVEFGYKLVLLMDRTQEEKARLGHTTKNLRMKLLRPFIFKAKSFCLGWTGW